jgi:hypothetical protein
MTAAERRRLAAERAGVALSPLAHYGSAIVRARKPST